MFFGLGSCITNANGVGMFSFVLRILPRKRFMRQSFKIVAFEHGRSLPRRTWTLPAGCLPLGFGGLLLLLDFGHRFDLGVGGNTKTGAIQVNLSGAFWKASGKLDP